MLGRAAIGAVAASLAVVATNAAAVAAPQPPFAHVGGFMTDSTGRVFVSHGVNLVYKFAPYEPSVTGFGEDDAAFLEREGFNSIRLGVIYKAGGPPPGVDDGAYPAKIAQPAALVERPRSAALLRFPHDMSNGRFQREAWPGWALP